MESDNQLKEMKSRLEEYQVKFDRHLEIYANNGKELKTLTDTILKIVPMFEENTKQTKEMYDVFSGIATTSKWTSKIVKWVVGIFLGIGSLIIMWNNINK